MNVTLPTMKEIRGFNPLKQTFFRACNVIPVPAQWAKLFQLGLQLEISEAELLKLIVNSVNSEKPVRFVL